MTRIKTLALTVAGGTLVVLGHAAPAVAGGQHHTESFSFHTDAQRQLTEACGFPVAMSLDGTWNVVTLTDDSGRTTKEIRNYRFRATFSANGVTVRGQSSGPEVLEVHEDGSSTVTVMGVVSRQVRGEGTVMQHAGRTVTQFDAAGEQVGEPVVFGQLEDAREVCSAFGPRRS